MLFREYRVAPRPNATALFQVSTSSVGLIRGFLSADRTYLMASVLLVERSGRLVVSSMNGLNPTFCKLNPGAVGRHFHFQFPVEYGEIISVIHNWHV